MLKKIALVLLCALPLGIFAQELKIGHVDSQGLMMAMPELGEIEKKIAAASEEWTKELQTMQEEYTTKLKDYQEKFATMPESIKQVRQSEIADIEQRYMSMQQVAASDLEKMQQDLVAPIQEKIRKAINEVAAENNYTYIMDVQVLHYHSPKSNDITPLVKKKLNIAQ